MKTIKYTVAVRDKGPVKNIPYIGRQGGCNFVSDVLAIEWLIDILNTGNYQLSKSCKWNQEQLNRYKDRQRHAEWAISTGETNV